MFSYCINQFELCFYTCNRNPNQYILIFIHFLHITLFFCFLDSRCWPVTFLAHPNLLSALLCSLEVDHLGPTPWVLMLSGFQLGSESGRHQQDMRGQKKTLGCVFNIPTSLKAAFLLSAVPSMTVGPSGGPSSSAPFLPCFFSPWGKTFPLLPASGCQSISCPFLSICPLLYK